MTEEQYLAHVLERIRAAIGSADTTVRERVKTLDEQKRYLWENRDIDPQEIRSVRENILNIHAIGESVIARRERLGRMLDTPYFGRIDFRENPGEGDYGIASDCASGGVDSRDSSGAGMESRQPQPIYIGVHTFRDFDTRMNRQQTERETCSHKPFRGANRGAQQEQRLHAEHAPQGRENHTGVIRENHISVTQGEGERSATNLVYDWRAPIASMYYDYELGPAAYISPAGEVTGEISLKRQYRIRGGRMEYMLESSVTVHDDILQRELSANADDKMRNIVATIQREQNRIIRDSEAPTLIIQGVAGSGKTSIALHRIAYLLYAHKDTLASRDILIISPNKVFADYISNVLPELGEETVPETGMAELLSGVLGGKLKYQTFFEQVAELSEKPAPDFIDRIAYKSTLEFAASLERFILYLENDCFRPVDLKIRHITIPREYIGEQFRRFHRMAVRERFDPMAEMIADELDVKYGITPTTAERNLLKHEIRGMFAGVVGSKCDTGNVSGVDKEESADKVGRAGEAGGANKTGDAGKTESVNKIGDAGKSGSTNKAIGAGKAGSAGDLQLYREFFEWLGKPEMFKMRRGHILEYSDLAPLAYLRIALDGIKPNTRVKHLLIDEMQDYTPVQYRVIQKLFPCRKTLLGDAWQSINPYGSSTAEVIQKTFTGGKMMKLCKSYRSTFEITDFAQHIRPNDELEPVARHGEKPQIMQFETPEAELVGIVRLIADFRKSGHKSLGIICKTESQAAELYAKLQHAGSKMADAVEGQACAETEIGGGEMDNTAGGQACAAAAIRTDGKIVDIAEWQVCHETGTVAGTSTNAGFDSDIFFLTSRSHAFARGVVITSAHMAKGLEFDDVIIPHADARNYHSEVDRSMLYVAATRAMHRLTLTYSKTPSEFLLRHSHASQ